MDSNVIYFEHLEVSIQTVDLAKVNHIFYTQNLITMRNTDNKMATEIYNYQEEFKYILFLHISDEGRYRTLIQELK